VRGAVEREGVIGAFYAQNAIVRAEIGLHHHVLRGHLLEQAGGIVLIGQIDAVADALGVAQLDGLADVEAQPIGRRQARRQLAGVQADVHLRVDGVQVVEHLHLQGIVAHGDEAVLGMTKLMPTQLGS